MNVILKTEMTVINTPQTTTRNINSNFTVILKNGIGVQVTAANGLMNALVMIPYSMKVWQYVNISY